MVTQQTYSNIAPVAYAALLPLLKDTVSYPSCNGGKYNAEVCGMAKIKCKTRDNLKWLKGGKECWGEEYLRLMEEKYPTEPVADENAVDTGEQKSGLSTGAKIGIAVGGIAVLGIALYFLMRKK